MKKKEFRVLKLNSESIVQKDVVRVAAKHLDKKINS